MEFHPLFNKKRKRERERERGQYHIGHVVESERSFSLSSPYRSPSLSPHYLQFLGPTPAMLRGNHRQPPLFRNSSVPLSLLHRALLSHPLSLSLKPIGYSPFDSTWATCDQPPLTIVQPHVPPSHVQKATKWQSTAHQPLGHQRQLMMECVHRRPRL